MSFNEIFLLVLMKSISLRCRGIVDWVVGVLVVIVFCIIRRMLVEFIVKILYLVMELGIWVKRNNRIV